jgi:hypothetical protein
LAHRFSDLRLLALLCPVSSPAGKPVRAQARTDADGNLSGDLNLNWCSAAGEEYNEKSLAMQCATLQPQSRAGYAASEEIRA